MHILMLSPLYAPYRGGAETQVRTLAEALVEIGHQVTVLTDRGHQRLAQQETIGGVQVLRTDLVGQDPGARPREDVVGWEDALFRMLAECEQLLRAGLAARPDIIHAQCQVSFLLGAILKEEYGCPLVVTPHETTPEEDGLGAARSRFLFTLPQIDLFLAGSRVFADQALALGRPPSATALVEFGVRPRLSGAQKPGTPRRTGQAATVLSVGRFKARKNQLTLLDAIELLSSRGRAVRCVLAGTCDAASVSYRDRLRVRAAQMTDVTIVEEAEDDAIAQLMREADLVVQASLAEGLGLASIEALLAGTPVLATPTSGAVEVLGAFPLLLTGGFTAADLAAAIEGALDRPEEYAAAARQAAESVRQRYDARANGGRVLTWYSQLAGRSGLPDPAGEREEATRW